MSEEKPSKSSKGLFGLFGERTPVVAVVRLTGVIGAAGPLRSGLSLAKVAGQLEKAFGMKRAEAVAIAVNSPGGSPVQSRLIFSRIRALAKEKEKPVFIFAEDVAASGGYMLALAGDEIYADQSSIIGSIGVISAGFGFVEAIDKLGVERRVYTAGKSKSVLDPFLPEKAEDVRRLKAVQEDVHALFKDMVRERRGGKLQGGDARLFNGEFWSGSQALELGLIDGLGDLRSVMQEKYGEKVKLKLVGSPRGWLFQKLPALPFFSGAGGEGALAPNFASNFADDLLAAVESRAIWSRFGI